MLTFKTLRALGAADALSVGRDTLLRGMVLIPLALAAGARWLFPPALERIRTLLPFDILPFYPQFISYVLLLLAPTICGMVVGFVLLDQRDDHTLAALQVTPLPLVGYLAYRLAAPMLLSLSMTLLALPLAGALPVGPPALLMLGLAAAPLAPLLALGLATFAANKVQGLALQKALSTLLIIPMLGQLLPQPWQLLLGLVPTYWPAALLQALYEQAWYAWLLLPAGLAYQGVLLLLLVRRFMRVAYQ